MSGAFFVIVACGPEPDRVGQEIVLAAGRKLVIGRPPNDGARIDDATTLVLFPWDTLNRSNTEIAPDGDARWVVRDLKSTNGTFVNGERLGSGRHVLAPGDRMTIGNTVTFEFRCR